MDGLPYEFRGARSPREARQDLLGIARTPEPYNVAQVRVEHDHGGVVDLEGHVTTEVQERGVVAVSVDGEFAFAFDEDRCRGAWLYTLDGADYFSLRIDLGWGCVALSDL